MKNPELIVVAGCNAAGKSTFIRTRLNELDGFEVLMTDVYKGRTKDLVRKAISQKMNILVETAFKDASSIDLLESAKNAGYQTSLIVLFLNTIQQSISRVAIRQIQQSGIVTPLSNIKINFLQGLKDAATYFCYFDRSDFIYTGYGDANQVIMSFHKNELLLYNSNDLDYPQKFADYSFLKDCLNEQAYHIIKANKNFNKNTLRPSTQIT